MRVGNCLCPLPTSWAVTARCCLPTHMLIFAFVRNRAKCWMCFYRKNSWKNKRRWIVVNLAVVDYRLSTIWMGQVTYDAGHKSSIVTYPPSQAAVLRDLFMDSSREGFHEICRGESHLGFSCNDCFTLVTMPTL